MTWWWGGVGGWGGYSDREVHSRPRDLLSISDLIFFFFLIVWILQSWPPMYTLELDKLGQMWFFVCFVNIFFFFIVCQPLWILFHDFMRVI